MNKQRNKFFSDCR